MFAFPAATTGFGLSPLTVEPDLDRDGVHKKNKDGVLRWAVQTLVTPPRNEAGFQPAPFVIKVTVASEAMPQFTAAAPAEFVGFRQFAWDSGSAKGIAFSAEAIRSVRLKASE